MAGTATEQDIEAMWRELEIGIKDVYAHRAMTTRRFMELYSYVYNYCTNTSNDNKGGGGGPGASRVRTGKLIRKRTANSTTSKYNTTFVGHDLYTRIKEFLKNYLTELSKEGADKMGEDLLSFYQIQWEHYTFSSKVMNGFCAYLNRHWVRRECEEGKDHVFQIYQCCLDMWRDTFFEQLNKNATTTLLNIIERHRNGEMVNERLIKDVISSYVDLGSDEPNSLVGGITNSNTHQNQTVKLGIYQRKFEDAFIVETENFYAKESALFIHSNPVPEYLKKAEQRLQEEERRVGLYLHTSTLPSLMKKCETILVERQLESIQSEFPDLLKNEMESDLARLYGLISRLDNAFGASREILEEHIAAEGALAIRELGDVYNKEPEQYVKTIIRVHNKYLNLCKSSFNSDSGFIAALDKACGRFINNNSVTESANSSQKSPEILARYCDQLLKKVGKNYNEDELEDLLNETMIVFKFIEDKDVFQKYYGRTLANRLVYQLSASDDAESSMITKLKQACGFEYTTKLHRMYQDIGLSKDMNEDFKKWIGENKLTEPFDMNVYVLTTGSWPFSSQLDFALPQEFGPSVTLFMQYYTDKHTGRKLNWVYSKSIVEVVTNGYQNKYTFTVGTVHAAVMLMFNDKDEYTVGELMSATELNLDLMTQVLQILCFRQKLMLCNTPEKDLSPASIISIFKQYKNKKMRVNLNIPLRLEAKSEDEKTRTSVEETRKWELQAAIVRVMKARKKLEHQLLISEVISMMNNRFKPSVALIKKCIDVLIEKEYIARDENAKDTYNYLA